MTVREVDSYLEESKRTGALVTWRYPVVQGITYIGQSEQIQILKDQYNVSKKKQTRHTELPCVESANKCTEPTEQTLHNTLTV